MTANIIHARGAEHFSVFRELLLEYAAARGLESTSVLFQQDLAELPGKYAEPKGCILLAMVDGAAAGCVAVRPLGDGVCEMKRLYVRPAFRKVGIGRILVEQILAEATLRGYRTMRLDTFPALMGDAVALYRKFGFRNIPPYWNNPLPGVEYMELQL
jgi:putative acetyltransferase